MVYVPKGNFVFRNAVTQVFQNQGFLVSATRRSLEYLADNLHLGLALIVHDTNSSFDPTLLQDSATTVTSFLSGSHGGTGVRVYQISSGVEWGSATANQPDSGRIIARPDRTTAFGGTHAVVGGKINKLTLDVNPVWTSLAKDFADDGNKTVKEAVGILVYFQVTAGHDNEANGSDEVIGWIDEGGFPFMGTGSNATFTQNSNGFLRALGL